MTNRFINIASLPSLISVAVFVMIFSFPAAHAKAQFDNVADLGGGSSYDYSYPDSGTSYDYSYPDTGTSYDYSYPDSTGYSYDYSYPDSTNNGYSYDYSYPDSSYTGITGYSSSGYPVSSYTGSGYVSGGYYSGPSYIPSVPHPVIPPVVPPSNTNINTCLNNSCNTNINAPTTITTNPAPVYQPIVYNNTSVVYTNPTPVCNTCGCLGYPICPHPIAYNYPATPYVSLSQVPYTGLDLGFWGTIAYWSFLALWCLAAAYLIVVKKVQNRMVRAVKNFLFGVTSTKVAYTNDTVVAAPAPQHSSLFTQADLAALAQMIRGAVEPTQEAQPFTPPTVAEVRAPQADVIDDFVMSQINRPRHA